MLVSSFLQMAKCNASNGCSTKTLLLFLSCNNECEFQALMENSAVLFWLWSISSFWVTWMQSAVWKALSHRLNITRGMNEYWYEPAQLEHLQFPLRGEISSVNIHDPHLNVEIKLVGFSKALLSIHFTLVFLNTCNFMEFIKRKNIIYHTVFLRGK